MLDFSFTTFKKYFGITPQTILNYYVVYTDTFVPVKLPPNNKKIRVNVFEICLWGGAKLLKDVQVRVYKNQVYINLKTYNTLFN